CTYVRVNRRETEHLHKNTPHHRTIHTHTHTNTDIQPKHTHTHTSKIRTHTYTHTHTHTWCFAFYNFQAEAAQCCLPPSLPLSLLSLAFFLSIRVSIYLFSVFN